MKKRMLRKRGKSFADIAALSKDLNEQRLFHGTLKKFVEPIYTLRGFDWRRSG